ncbi:hypothetical protein DFJ73DRAFT_812156 [Zopfochytrium polystomum]|nr:hypothetical protein DFJ73DRAFT_812156 [Zopfochytrium polystomum]
MTAPPPTDPTTTTMTTRTRSKSTASRIAWHAIVARCTVPTAASAARTSRSLREAALHHGARIVRLALHQRGDSRHAATAPTLLHFRTPCVINAVLQGLPAAFFVDSVSGGGDSNGGEELYPTVLRAVLRHTADLLSINDHHELAKDSLRLLCQLTALSQESFAAPLRDAVLFRGLVDLAVELPDIHEEFRPRFSALVSGFPDGVVTALATIPNSDRPVIAILEFLLLELKADSDKHFQQAAVFAPHLHRAAAPGSETQDDLRELLRKIERYSGGPRFIEAVSLQDGAEAFRQLAFDAVTNQQLASALFVRSCDGPVSFDAAMVLLASKFSSATPADPAVRALVSKLVLEQLDGGAAGDVALIGIAVVSLWQRVVDWSVANGCALSLTATFVDLVSRVSNVGDKLRVWEIAANVACKPDLDDDTGCIAMSAVLTEALAAKSSVEELADAIRHHSSPPILAIIQTLAETLKRQLRRGNANVHAARLLGQAGSFGNPTLVPSRQFDPLVDWIVSNCTGNAYQAALLDLSIAFDRTGAEACIKSFIHMLTDRTQANGPNESNRHFFALGSLSALFAQQSVSNAINSACADYLVEAWEAELRAVASPTFENLAKAVDSPTEAQEIFDKVSFYREGANSELSAAGYSPSCLSVGRVEGIKLFALYGKQGCITVPLALRMFRCLLDQVPMGNYSCHDGHLLATTRSYSMAAVSVVRRLVDLELTAFLREVLVTSYQVWERHREEEYHTGERASRLFRAAVQQCSVMVCTALTAALKNGADGAVRIVSLITNPSIPEAAAAQVLAATLAECTEEAATVLLLPAAARAATSHAVKVDVVCQLLSAVFKHTRRHARTAPSATIASVSSSRPTKPIRFGVDSAEQAFIALARLVDGDEVRWVSPQGSGLNLRSAVATLVEWTALELSWARREMHSRGALVESPYPSQLLLGKVSTQVVKHGLLLFHAGLGTEELASRRAHLLSAAFEALDEPELLALGCALVAAERFSRGPRGANDEGTLNVEAGDNDGVDTTAAATAAAAGSIPSDPPRLLTLRAFRAQLSALVIRAVDLIVDGRDDTEPDSTNATMSHLLYALGPRLSDRDTALAWQLASPIEYLRRRRASWSWLDAGFVVMWVERFMPAMDSMFG